MPRQPTIAITTDFGRREPYVGIMQGVILRICPQAPIIDLTHELPPQDVLAGTLALSDAMAFMPQGTIYLSVIDPGVGSRRRPIAVQLNAPERAGQTFFVGPDNGLATPLLDRATSYHAVELANRDYQLPNASHTFHGRDIFAPAVAHLAAGLAISKFGSTVTDPVRIDIPPPDLSDSQRIAGQVIAIDHFGNLITNVTASDADHVKRVTVGGHDIDQVGQTFADVNPGELVAYFGSTGRLEIALRNGSAAEVLGTKKGDAMTVQR